MTTNRTFFADDCPAAGDNKAAHSLSFRLMDGSELRIYMGSRSFEDLSQFVLETLASPIYPPKDVDPGN